MKPSKGTTMLAHNHDRRRDPARNHPPLRRQGPRRYSAAVPAHALDAHGCLLDQLIHFAFATLDAPHLDLRVYEAE